MFCEEYKTFERKSLTPSIAFFSLLFQQGAPDFYLALGLANFIAGTGHEIHSLELGLKMVGHPLLT